MANLQKVLVVLRLHARENAKARPSWFSKESCVRSLLLAIDFARAQGLAVESTVYVDSAGGPVRNDLRRMIQEFDHRVDFFGGSARRSLQFTIRDLVRSRNLRDETIVYLVEDDHLHARHAIHALAEMPTEYSLLYSISADPDDVRKEGRYRWVVTHRGVSSFAVSDSRLKKDWRMIWAVAWSGPAFDMLTWRVVEGKAPFTLKEVLSPLSPDFPLVRGSWPKAIWQVMWRVIVSLWSFSRPAQRISALYPNGATHAENGWTSPGVDWAEIAATKE